MLVAIVLITGGSFLMFLKHLIVGIFNGDITLNVINDYKTLIKENKNKTDEQLENIEVPSYVLAMNSFAGFVIGFIVILIYNSLV